MQCGARDCQKKAKRVCMSAPCLNAKKVETQLWRGVWNTNTQDRGRDGKWKNEGEA